MAVVMGVAARKTMGYKQGAEVAGATGTEVEVDKEVLVGVAAR